MSNALITRTLKRRPPISVLSAKAFQKLPKHSPTSLETVLLHQINSHKPVTTSLLTLHEDMMPWQRLRTHPERTYRGRAAPDGDSLRRDILQRNAHQGLSNPPSSPLSPAASAESNLEPDVKPQLFPRAGDLLRLHRADSTSLIDDWRLRT
jgi:hypothetical protein